MKKDWRLAPHSWADGGMADRTRAAEKACIERVSMPEVERVGSALCVLAVDRVQGLPNDGSATQSIADEDLSTAARGIAAAILDDDGVAPETIEATLLSAVIVRQLASAVADTPAQWLRAFDIASRLPDGWSRFLEACDVNAIRANSRVLFELPSLQNGRDWIDTFSRLRAADEWDGFVAEMQRRGYSRPDPWRELDDLERFSSELRLSLAVRMRSALARRGGADVYSEFLGRLPFPIFVQVEVGELESLDGIAELLRATLQSADVGTDARRIISLVILRRAIELFENVWKNLARGADSRWTVADAPGAKNQLERCAEALGTWRERELSGRAEELAGVLARDVSVGVPTAICVLQNAMAWSVDDRDTESEPTTLGEIRDALAFALLNVDRDTSALADAVLSVGSRSSAVFSAMHVFHLASPAKRSEREILARRLWAAYSDWTAAMEFEMHSPLRGDQFGLAWRAAGVLAELDDADSAFAALVGERQVRGEGWKHDDKRFFESIDRVAHVTLVGAMSTEWLTKAQRMEAARATFDVAWFSMHRWMRGVSHLGAIDAAVSTALSALWARLPMIYGAEAEALALEAVQGLDRIEWVLLACKNLQANVQARPGGGDAAIGEALRTLIGVRFREQFPALRAHIGIAPENLSQFERWFSELTGVGGIT
jgi:hypothetical protein